MKLSNLLDPELLFWDVELKDKNELYEFIAKTISEKYELKEEDIIAALEKRDALGTLVLPNSIAVPHGRLEGFNDLLISVIKTKNEIEFEANKAKLIFCIVTGKRGSNTYLKLLAKLAELSEEHGEAILSLSSKEDFIEFINKNDIRLSEPVKVKDVMAKEPIVAHLEDTIEKITNIMKKHNIIYLPVVDENNKYIGKIDILDILKIAFPDYILMLNDLSFLETFRAYEEFEKEEKVKKVKDLYNPAPEKIVNVEDSIVEMGYKFIKNKWHHAAVVDNEGKLVGVVTSRTILNNIVRV